MSSVRPEKIQAFPGPGGPDSGPLGPDFGEFRAPAPGGKIHISFLNGASGLELVYFWSLADPPDYKTDGKRWAATPPFVPMGFAVGGGRWGRNNRRFPALKLF